jgi:hypothetical protein
MTIEETTRLSGRGGWLAPAMYLARVELRSRRRSALLFALATGVTAAVLVALVAMARQGPDAFERFVEFSRPTDAAVFAFDDSRLPELEAAVAAADGVASSATKTFVVFGEVRADGTVDTRGVVSGLAHLGGDQSLDRPAVLRGRMPRKPFELAVNEALAERRGLRPGAQMRLAVFNREQTDEVGLEPDGRPAHGNHMFTVTAIAKAPADLQFQADAQPGTVYERETEYAWFPAALWDRFDGDLPNYGVGVVTRLDGDEGMRSLQALVEGPFAGAADVEPGNEDTSQHDAVRRVIDLQSGAVYGFAAVLGLVALVAGSLAIGRHVLTAELSSPAVRAVGAGRTTMVAAAAIWAAAIAGAGSVIAVGGAAALSLIGPIGIAGRAELGSGPNLDVPVTTLGVLLTFVVVVGAAIVTVLRQHYLPARTQPRPAAAPGTVARLGGRPAIVIGAWLATSRRGEGGRVPARTALVGAVAGIVGVAAAVTFGASLERVTTTPAAYGWSWDVAAANCSDADCTERAAALLAGNPDVQAFTGISGGGGAVDGIELDEVGVAIPGRGWAGGRILTGSPPRAADEVVLASDTLEATGAQIGGQVRVRFEDGDGAPFRIVGVFTPPVQFSGGRTLTEGATITKAGARRAAPPELREEIEGIPASQYLVTFDPGVDREEALTRLRADFPGTVLGPIRTDPLEGAHRLRLLPTVLAGVLALLGVATLAHLGATTARRRASALGVLRAIGCARKELRAMLRWQALLTAGTALLIGMPLGVAAGRAAWRLAADGLGTPEGPMIPLGGLAVVTTATLLVAAAIGTGFGARAARRSSLALLRD